MLKRSWAGEVRNVSVLVAIGVGEDGYSKVLGITEGHKEDKAAAAAFLSTNDQYWAELKTDPIQM